MGENTSVDMVIKNFQKNKAILFHRMFSLMVWLWSGQVKSWLSIVFKIIWWTFQILNENSTAQCIQCMMFELWNIQKRENTPFINVKTILNPLREERGGGDFEGGFWIYVFDWLTYLWMLSRERNMVEFCQRDQIKVTLTHTHSQPHTLQ